MAVCLGALMREAEEEERPGDCGAPRWRRGLEREERGEGPIPVSRGLLACFAPACASEIDPPNEAVLSKLSVKGFLAARERVEWKRLLLSSLWLVGASRAPVEALSTSIRSEVRVSPLAALSLSACEASLTVVSAAGCEMAAKKTERFDTQTPIACRPAPPRNNFTQTTGGLETNLVCGPDREATHKLRRLAKVSDRFIDGGVCGSGSG